MTSPPPADDPPSDPPAPQRFSPPYGQRAPAPEHVSAPYGQRAPAPAPPAARRKWMIVVAGTVLALLLVVVAVSLRGSPSPSPAPVTPATATPETPPPPPGNGLIAFTSSREGPYRIFVMEPDGSGQRPLIRTSTDDMAPHWSPDGQRVVFARWQPDVEVYAIAVMKADGSGLRLLTDPATGMANWPAWSPDGTKIVFASRRDGPWETYVMDADGANQQRITHAGAGDFPGSWSPDGRHIVFEGQREADGNHVFVMDADGSNVRRLSEGPAGSMSPDWSPDGDRIAYANADGAIVTVTPEGTDIRVLTEGPEDAHPRWSPDGTRIVFERGRGAGTEIWVMDADGADLTRLTDNSSEDRWPHWQPVPAA